MYPSRKKNDFFHQRAGVPIPLEKRATISNTATRTSAGTTTIYTCPANKKATIVFLNIYSDRTGSVGTMTTAIQVSGSPVVGFVVGVETLSYTQEIKYEDGIVVVSGQTIQLNCDNSSSFVTAIVRVIEESLSSENYLAAQNF